MGRGRLSMELIMKEKSRRVTFQKRKKGLMKKAYEFSTLCGVDTCVIVYENPSDEPAQSETWPQDPAEIRRILDKYKEVVSKGKQPRKNYDLTEFFRDRKAKIESEISKVRKEIFNLLYPTWDERLEKFGVQELRALGACLDKKVVECEQQMKMLKEMKNPIEQASTSYAANNQLDILHASSQVKLSAFNDVKLFEDQLVSPAIDDQFASLMSSSTNQKPIGCSYSEPQFTGLPYTFCTFPDFDVSQLIPFDRSTATQQQLGLPGTCNVPATSVALSVSAAMENVINPDNQISAISKYNQISAISHYNQSLQAFDDLIQPYMLSPPFDCSLPLASTDVASTSTQQGSHSDNYYDIMQHAQLFNYFNGRNI